MLTINIPLAYTWFWLCLASGFGIGLLGYISIRNYLKNIESVLKQTEEWDKVKRIYRE